MFVDIIKDNSVLVIMGLMAALFIGLIWNITLSVKLLNLKRKYNGFMEGASGSNLEGVLQGHIQSVQKSTAKVEDMGVELKDLKVQVDKCLQKHGIVRYNAFGDTASDLSFSIALLDNHNDGVVLTGIYGRNESFSYAKPIEKGVSQYALSTEETIALEKSKKRV